MKLRTDFYLKSKNICQYLLLEVGYKVVGMVLGPMGDFGKDSGLRRCPLAARKENGS